jgi:hypothetical protein
VRLAELDAAGRARSPVLLFQGWLMLRFGDLSEDIVARLHAADSESLKRWKLRAFDGCSIEEIFS